MIQGRHCGFGSALAAVFSNTCSPVERGLTLSTHTTSTLRPAHISPVTISFIRTRFSIFIKVSLVIFPVLPSPPPCAFHGWKVIIKIHVVIVVAIFAGKGDSGTLPDSNHKRSDWCPYLQPQAQIGHHGWADLAHKKVLWQHAHHRNASRENDRTESSQAIYLPTYDQKQQDTRWHIECIFYTCLFIVWQGGLHQGSNACPICAQRIYDITQESVRNM